MTSTGGVHQVKGVQLEVANSTLYRKKEIVIVMAVDSITITKLDV